ncbi:something about silencing protein 10-like [Liolophura sinensis]|uniref:something about silencing protein 10-like n=1 Tax=Liolophura sinensis TaxID=3198878 RepID=UPI00315857E2
MGKRGKGKRQQSRAVVQYDSDDEKRYANEATPDPTAEDFFHDEVDQFHLDKEKILLAKGVNMEPAELSSDDQEEVLGLGLGEESGDDDEEIAGYKKTLRNLKHVTSRKDELGSDIEEDREGYGERVWGNRKSKYYGADVDDDDIDISGSEGEEGTAALEEEEALALQRKMAEQLDDQDFGLDSFKPSSKNLSSKTEGEKISQDLSKVSKREKLELLEKQSPELLELIEDYVVKMTTVKDVLQPLRRLIQSGQLPTGKAADYVDSKFSLYLNYCVNISFYMMLKAKCTPVENHPVVKRLLQYRNLIKQMEPLDKLLKPEMDAILERVHRGEELMIQPSAPTAAKSSRKADVQLMKAALDSTNPKRLSELISDSEDDDQSGGDTGRGGRSKKKKKSEDGQYMTRDEAAALEYYEMMKGGRKSDLMPEDYGYEFTSESDIHQRRWVILKQKGEITGDIMAEEGDGKRAITYQIAKNKGLTPHRKKEQRNPRVKHRMKYRKAKIRRKGMIREPRKEINPYAGELSGIRAGVKRSIRLK